MKKEINKEILFDFIENVVSRLNRHRFLHEKDMEEWMLFICQYLYNKGIYVISCGGAWCEETTKERAEEYLNEHSDLFNEYYKWCDSQR